MKRHSIVFTAALFITTFMASSKAFAQNEEAEIFSPEWAANIRFSLYGGAMYQFETDLDDGDGEFAAIRGGLGITARTVFSEELSLSIRGDYQINSYDFSGDTFAGGDLWDDIHTFSVGAIFDFEASDDWRLFAGPVLQFSFEGGAQGGEAITFGGVFGVAYRFSQNLTLGGGIGITSQLEDDMRFFPIFVVNWQITDQLALRNSPLIGAGSRDGLELVYAWDNRWEFAIGGGYYYNRFRIEGEAAYEDGIGEETGIPIWGRISHACTDNFKINIYGGVMAGGELRLEDEDGDGVANSDYDPAPFVGISGTYRF